MTIDDVQIQLTTLYWSSKPGPIRDQITQIKHDVNRLSDSALAMDISNRTENFSNLAAMFDKSIIISIQNLVNSIKDDIEYANQVNNTLGILEKLVSSVPL
jgi:hypothetical protein